jgi:hypothetical protein
VPIYPEYSVTRYKEIGLFIRKIVLPQNCTPELTNEFLPGSEKCRIPQGSRGDGHTLSTNIYQRDILLVVLIFFVEKDLVQKADDDRQYFVSELDQQSLLLDQMASQKKGNVSFSITYKYIR